MIADIMAVVFPMIGGSILGYILGTKKRAITMRVGEIKHWTKNPNMDNFVLGCRCGRKHVVKSVHTEDT